MLLKRSMLRMLVAALVLTSVPLAAASARATYEKLLDQEQALRGRLQANESSPAVLKEARRLISAYERLADRHRATGYADNALQQGGALAADVWKAFGQDQDRKASVRLYSALIRSYPSSSLVKRARAGLKAVDVDQPAARAAKPAGSGDTKSPAAAAAVGTGGSGTDSGVLPVPLPAPIKARDVTPPPPAVPDGTQADDADRRQSIKRITRTTLNNLVRVTIELDHEVAYHEERIVNPDRVFLDLPGVSPGHVTREQSFDDGVVRQLRVGRREGHVTRVVLEIDGTATHSVFALYNPYRIVIDCQRPGTDPGRLASAPAAPVTTAAVDPPKVEPAPRLQTPAASPRVRESARAEKPTLPVREPARAATLPPTVAPAPVPSAPPAANLKGSFSLSRQLGLGISRIVIDPGHGGHDPGAQVTGLNESDLVLDVALRLEQLLLAQPGVEVVMTRRTDEFIPLEERTAIANREGADLFLSIHANASRNRKARGIETYFLNFSSNRAAEAVAARENAASGRTMHSLPDIVKAITLNDKVDESRDFATMVQRAMVEQLRERDSGVRDLGVKQAPFVVLIGASMPSVLAEISFVTNPQEARLLKTPTYRQHIAEALFDGVAKYQRSLKSVRTVANQE